MQFSNALTLALPHNRAKRCDSASAEWSNGNRYALLAAHRTFPLVGPIVGTLNPAHLHENIAAMLHGPLPAEVYNEARRRLTAARAVPA